MPFRFFILTFLLGLILVLPLKGQNADQVRIQQIQIEGNDITRPSIILREMNLHQGDIISNEALPELLQENKRRLLNLSLFTSVDISSQKTDSGLTLLLKVHERFYYLPRPILQLADRNFNVWWTEKNADLRRINIGMKVSNNNFRGNLETLTAIVQAGYTQQLGLEYIRPYVDKRQQQGIGLFGGITQSGELAYKTVQDKQQFAKLPGQHIVRNYYLGAAWYYRPAYAVKHSISLSWLHNAVSDTILALNPDFNAEPTNTVSYLELSYRLDLNLVDNWNYPLRGFKTVSYALFRQGTEHMQQQLQFRTEAGLFGHIPSLGQKDYYSLIFRGRLSFQDKVPYFLQTALGTKTDYVRGYEYYVMDGAHYGLLRMDLKHELFSKTFSKLPFRYLQSLPLRLYPKLFADAGYAYNPYTPSGRLSNRWLYAAGFGIDIVSAYDLKIRIEAAVNHLGQYGLYLHLNSE